jgi:hypothetical protein
MKALFNRILMRGLRECLLPLKTGVDAPPKTLSRRTIHLALVILVSGWSGLEVRPQDSVPQFRKYPVAEIYNGKNAPVVLKTADDRMFKTRLREASKTQKPNFAGRYILTTWGCGTSCVMGAVIDAKTGAVHWFDFTVCCWPTDGDDRFRPIEVRLNSKLIVFAGARNEKEGDVGAHFYKFDGGRFVHIKSILKENQNRN